MSWIPVEERLPERGYWFVTCEELANWREAYYDNGLWWNDEDKDAELPYHVIAWQPLPEPYQKPRRFVVAHGVLGWEVHDNPKSGLYCYAANIPTREGAQEIADIYERLYGGKP